MGNSPPGERHTVRMDQLCIGLHIRLDSWLGHPFLFSSFKIKDQKQIEAIRSMGLAEIEYLPQKSTARPLPPAAVSAQPQPDADRLVLEELMREKKERIDTLQRERERIQVAERKYVKTANAVQNVMRLANNSPAQAAEQSREIAIELAEIFLSEENPYIHLMGDNVSDDSAYFHSLNVTVLSLILARAVGIYDPDTMRDITQGAVLHDIGKAMIPSQVLLKGEELTQAETKLLQLHPGYGVKLLQPVEELPRLAGNHFLPSRNDGRQRLSKGPQGRCHQPGGAHRHHRQRLRQPVQPANRQALEDAFRGTVVHVQERIGEI